MEKRLNKKIENYVTLFKDKIRLKINDLSFTEKTKMIDLVEFIYEYERFELLKNDLSKRKRIQNSIPNLNRCGAKRANGEQCTRRRKDDFEYCGTHTKGTPNGKINLNQCGDCAIKTVEVFAQDIFGIVYYIDYANNVYNTEDVLGAKQNPRIIAKYVNENGNYTIPEFGLV